MNGFSRHQVFKDKVGFTLYGNSSQLLILFTVRHITIPLPSSFVVSFPWVVGLIGCAVSLVGRAVAVGLVGRAVAVGLVGSPVAVGLVGRPVAVGLVGRPVAVGLVGRAVGFGVSLS